MLKKILLIPACSVIGYTVGIYGYIRLRDHMLENWEWDEVEDIG